MASFRRPGLALLLASLLVCSASFAFAQDGEQAKQEDFQEKLAENEAAQEHGEVAPAKLESQIVEEAPKAVLASGTGDVDTTGKCAADIDNFCQDVKAGEGRLADCLSKQREQEANGNVEGKTLSEECIAELDAFIIDRATNINKNIPLAQACKKDVKAKCKDVDPKDEGAVLACLREVKNELSEACKNQVFKAELDAANDFRADPDLFEQCKGDAEQLCKGVEPGEGRVQACLRDHRSFLSWECQEELFRQEVENADDMRLSVRLLRKCMGDKQKFCADVAFGNSRAKDCLEEHRNDEGFSPECKEEFEAMMERRAADFRLDFKLRELCKKDIEDVCGYEKESLDSVEGFDARVIQCLQDYRDELNDAECKNQVHKLIERASQDIRFDEPLADACYQDRKQFCANVNPGSARVIRCLQDNREKLSYECRATLFDQEVRMAEDLDFKFPLKRACAAETAKFCGSTPKGHARVIRCLQDHVDDDGFSAECKAEVERDQLRSSEDYRLNYRLKNACQSDIDTHCPDICPFMGQSCGGRVLRCLSDKYEELGSKACADEVFYFLKMEVNDFRNDVMLAEACRGDVDKFCKKVQPGEGRVHECLRNNFDALSEKCRQEEMKLNIIQSRDVRLRPKLNKLCSQEMVIFCKDIKPGKGRVFKCLMENLAKSDFGEPCREQMELRSSLMQTDYRLDYGVSTQCEHDVEAHCADAKSKLHRNAAVFKCLVGNFGVLSDTCQTELSRAVRLALWDFKKGGALTGVCDSDVDNNCRASEKNRGVWGIGAVGRCLSRRVAEGQRMDKECRALVVVAAPKDMMSLLAGDPTVAAVAEKLEALTTAAGVNAQLLNPYKRGASVITLTGWVALAAVVSLAVVAMAVIILVYRRLRGLDKPYTVYTAVKETDEPSG